MKTLILLAAALAATPALAQHQGHDRPVPTEQSEHGASPADTHTGHHMQNEAAAEPDHSMHRTAPDDPPVDHSGHTGHQMDAAQSPGTHQDHDMGGQEAAIPQSGPPPEAFTGPEHAADTLFAPEIMAEARAALLPELGGAMHRLLSVDRFEAQLADGEDGYVWELNAWYGGDIDRLWIKSEGEGEFGGSLEEAEIQALWSHAIGPYFDVQAGIRYDIRPNSAQNGADRAHAVLGIQGLAPYFFEIDVAGFLSDAGDLTARIEAEYDQRITQRLILQPRIELDLAAQDIPEIGIGSGLSDLAAGLRLRYEIVPEFAPYIGAEWQRQFGDTADFTRIAGGDPDRIVFLAGLKIWF
ncbi:copper resistance protein B [Parasphingopyxis lamellibrachiae]|uniref:Copper resistance protein B n=1 Tax=Parasphingopyxis lamellibrachiae TaxID=680125 RepID=A0A3D9FDL1_9SPHN|nr:copper resistance protein B [Parasphingopyxis lamellibrachiae]RED15914.1 copper resistance protein B [Parasphingopyxis lamellibrachiae]